MLLLLASEAGSAIDASTALAGLPVAVVVIAGTLVGWRLLATGRIVLGREHEAAATTAAERLAEMTDDRDFWRSAAMRGLNLGEAIAGRRGHP